MIPILMYHNVVKPADFGNTETIKNYKDNISFNEFHYQMVYLKDSKFKVLSINNIYKKLIAAENTDHKCLGLTFDDGYSNIFYNVYPILSEYSFEATVFVIVDRVGRPGYLSWGNLELLRKEGIDIQSHCLTHWPLELLKQDEVWKELEVSKKILESRLGKSIDFVSFPQGSYNQKIIEIARKIGYLGCCTSDIDFFNPKKKYDYKIERIPMLPHCKFDNFRKIVRCNERTLKRLSMMNRIKGKIKKAIGLENYLRAYSMFYRVKGGIFENKIIYMCIFI